MSENTEYSVRPLLAGKHAEYAQQNGWSLAFAAGYVRGQIERRRGNLLSNYYRVGIDQYALGFRAGYYLRASPDRAGGSSRDPGDYLLHGVTEDAVGA